MRTKSLPAGAQVILDISTPPEDPDLLGGAMLVWAPETSGGAARVDDAPSDGWVGTGRVSYTTPRAGRYAFGFLAFDEAGTGHYTLRASWLPRVTAQSPQWLNFYPHRRLSGQHRAALPSRPATGSGPGGRVLLEWSAGVVQAVRGGRLRRPR